MEAGGLAAECPPGMSGGIGRRGEFAVEQIDRAAWIDAKRQRPAAAREGQRDMADSAVAADGADMARILIDRQGETGAAFRQDDAGAAGLESQAQRRQPLRTMPPRRRIVDQLDDLARARRHSPLLQRERGSMAGVMGG